MFGGMAGFHLAMYIFTCKLLRKGRHLDTRLSILFVTYICETGPLFNSLTSWAVF